MSDIPLTVSTPKAMFVHACWWCNDPIVRGEVHAEADGQWRGELQSWRMHIDCLNAAQTTTRWDEPFCDRGHERGKTCADCEP